MSDKVKVCLRASFDLQLDMSTCFNLRPTHEICLVARSLTCFIIIPLRNHE